MHYFSLPIQGAVLCLLGPIFVVIAKLSWIQSLQVAHKYKNVKGDLYLNLTHQDPTLHGITRIVINSCTLLVIGTYYLTNRNK